MAPTPQLPSKPSKYATSEQVRSSIGLAYSNFHNPRGLEKMWNSPWNETFSGLVEQYNGLFTVHAEYPMFLPSLVVKDLQLRQKFAENNLDYHNQTSREETAVNVPTGDNDILGDLPPVTSTRDTTVPDNEILVRKSTRISEAQSKAENDRINAHKAKIETLWQERDELILEREATLKRNSVVTAEVEDAYNEDEPFFDQEISLQSAASVADQGSLNWIPDNVVNHVASIKLPAVPEKGSQYNKEHYQHRAGRKVYHYCTAIINELKAPPPRQSTDLVAHSASVKQTLRLAKRQLLEYCVAYFECHRNANSVIIIASAGPFWQWCCIRREDVPQWDWVSHCLMDSSLEFDEKFYKTWNARFDKHGSYSILGTKTSDERLTLINKQYLHPMITDGHTPAAPNFSWGPVE
ncbi:hypothetical protein CVT25_014641 [Psilocybe cyanescens]|uniref:Uncharacterized protein n=1 Tax=Psilocybe cyanescens TaxID=93625 RepID=A0A409WTZ2_PSICY|nr:hypothetical protein CVT25_014641 [Psilocybe cyanescens]